MPRVQEAGREQIDTDQGKDREEPGAGGGKCGMTVAFKHSQQIASPRQFTKNKSDARHSYAASPFTVSADGNAPASA